MPVEVARGTNSAIGAARDAAVRGRRAGRPLCNDPKAFLSADHVPGGRFTVRPSCPRVVGPASTWLDWVSALWVDRDDGERNRPHHGVQYWRPARAGPVRRLARGHLGGLQRRAG